MTAAETAYAAVNALTFPQDPQERETYYTAKSAIEKTFRDQLAAEHLTPGLPEAAVSKVYQLAYEHGHSSGYSEVEHYFIDFADLANTVYTAV